MRYLGLALACEGPTDFKFLAPLLRRVVEDQVLRATDKVVDVGDVLAVLADDNSYTNQCDEVAANFEEGRLGAEILFIHTDAGKGVEDAIETRVRPLVERLGGLEDGPCVVAVVPDRETEAWMIADRSAVAATLGVSSDLVPTGVSPRLVSSILDPKMELRMIADSVDTGSGRVRAVRRRGSRLDQMYDGLGSDCSIQTLMEVPAFVTFLENLERCLYQLGART